MVPNKTDALAYFDGTAAAPTRYAHVRLDVRATEQPYYADILVGPLPVVNGTTSYSPLEYTATRKTAGRVRNLDADSDSLYSEWLYKVGESISDITLDLWGGVATGGDDDTLDIWGIDPLWQDDDRVVRWDTFWNIPSDIFDAETLLPLGLYFKSDVTGRDPSKWQLQGWFYNGIFYETTDAFRAAYYSPGFVKNAPNVEGDWARTDRIGDVLPFDTQTPPISVAPSGNRFAVDPVKKYVEWMEWSFYVGFTRDTGITLYDSMSRSSENIGSMLADEDCHSQIQRSTDSVRIRSTGGTRTLRRQRSDTEWHILLGLVLRLRTVCLPARTRLRLSCLCDVSEHVLLRQRNDPQSCRESVHVRV